MVSSDVLFCPQPKDIQFTVTEEERNWKHSYLGDWNQKMSTFFPSEITQTSWSIIKSVCDEFNGAVKD